MGWVFWAFFGATMWPGNYAANAAAQFGGSLSGAAISDLGLNLHNVAALWGMRLHSGNIDLCSRYQLHIRF